MGKLGERPQLRKKYDSILQRWTLPPGDLISARRLNRWSGVNFNTRMQQAYNAATYMDQVLQVPQTTEDQSEVAGWNRSLQFGPMPAPRWLPTQDVPPEQFPFWGITVDVPPGSPAIWWQEVLEARIIHGWIPVDELNPAKSRFEELTAEARTSFAMGNERFLLRVSEKDYIDFSLLAAAFVQSADAVQKLSETTQRRATANAKACYKEYSSFGNRLLHQCFNRSLQIRRTVDQDFVNTQKANLSSPEVQEAQVALVQLMEFVAELQNANWYEYHTSMYRHWRGPLEGPTALTPVNRLTEMYMEQLMNYTADVNITWNAKQPDFRVALLMQRDAVTWNKAESILSGRVTEGIAASKTINSMVFHPTAWKQPFIQLRVCDWEYYKRNNIFEKYIRRLEAAVQSDYAAILWREESKRVIAEPSVGRKRKGTAAPATKWRTDAEYGENTGDYRTWLNAELHKNRTEDEKQTGVQVQVQRTFIAQRWVGTSIPFKRRSEQLEEPDITYGEVFEFVSDLLAKRWHIHRWVFQHGPTKQLEDTVMQAAYYLLRSYLRLKELRADLADEDTIAVNETLFRTANYMSKTSHPKPLIDYPRTDVKLAYTKWEKEAANDADVLRARTEMDEAYISSLYHRHFNIDNTINEEKDPFMDDMKYKCAVEKTVDRTNGMLTAKAEEYLKPDWLFVALYAAYHRQQWLEVYFSLTAALCERCLQLPTAATTDQIELQTRMHTQMRIHTDVRTLIDFALTSRNPSDEAIAALQQQIPTLADWMAHNNWHWFTPSPHVPGANPLAGIRQFISVAYDDLAMLYTFRCQLFASSTETQLRNVLHDYNGYDFEEPDQVSAVADALCVTYRELADKFQPFDSNSHLSVVRRYELDAARQTALTPVMTATHDSYETATAANQLTQLHEHVRNWCEDPQLLLRVLNAHLLCHIADDWPTAPTDVAWHQPAFVVRNVIPEETPWYPLPLEDNRWLSRGFRLDGDSDYQMVFSAPPVGYRYQCRTEQELVFILPEVGAHRDKSRGVMDLEPDNFILNEMEVQLRPGVVFPDDKEVPRTRKRLRQLHKKQPAIYDLQQWMQSTQTYVQVLQRHQTLIVNQPFVSLIVYRLYAPASPNEVRSRWWKPTITYGVAPQNAATHDAWWSSNRDLVKGTPKHQTMSRLPPFLQLMWAQRALPTIPTIGAAQLWQPVNVGSDIAFPFVDLTQVPPDHPTMRHRLFIDGLFKQRRLQRHVYDWQLKEIDPSEHQLRFHYRQLRQMPDERSHELDSMQCITTAEPVWITREREPNGVAGMHYHAGLSRYTSNKNLQEHTMVVRNTRWPEFLHQGTHEMPYNEYKDKDTHLVKCYVTHQLLIQSTVDPTPNGFLMVLTWVEVDYEYSQQWLDVERLIVWTRNGLENKLTKPLKTGGVTYTPAVYDAIANTAQATMLERPTGIVSVVDPADDITRVAHLEMNRLENKHREKNRKRLRKWKAANPGIDSGEDSDASDGLEIPSDAPEDEDEEKADMVEQRKRDQANRFQQPTATNSVDKDTIDEQIEELAFARTVIGKHIASRESEAYLEAQYGSKKATALDKAVKREIKAEEKKIRAEFRKEKLTIQQQATAIEAALEEIWEEESDDESSDDASDDSSDHSSDDEDLRKPQRTEETKEDATEDMQEEQKEDTTTEATAASLVDEPMAALLDPVGEPEPELESD
jgi:hypothetical protein